MSQFCTNCGAPRATGGACTACGHPGPGGPGPTPPTTGGSRLTGSLAGPGGGSTPPPNPSSGPPPPTPWDPTQVTPSTGSDGWVGSTEPQDHWTTNPPPTGYPHGHDGDPTITQPPVDPAAGGWGEPPYGGGFRPEEPPEKPGRSPRLPIIIGAIVLVLLLAVGAAFLLLRGGDDSDEVVAEQTTETTTAEETTSTTEATTSTEATTTTVPAPDVIPDFSGMSLINAETLADSLGVTLVERSVIADDVDLGTIIDQDPAAGSDLTDQVVVTVTRAEQVSNLDERQVFEGDGVSSGPVSIDGRDYARSIHVNSRGVFTTPNNLASQYDLRRKHFRFTATIGITDSSASDGKAEFSVECDGRPIEGARWTMAFGESKDIDVSIEGCLRMTLRVDGFPSSESTVAAWADPVVTHSELDDLDLSTD